MGHGQLGRPLASGARAALAHLLPWTLGRRTRIRIAGASMAPTLAPGDQVLVDPGAYRRARVRPGHVVLALHPYRTDVHLVKRVAAVAADGRCTLAGDNPEASTDSASFGTVAAGAILGRVVLRLA